MSSAHEYFLSPSQLTSRRIRQANPSPSRASGAMTLSGLAIQLAQISDPTLRLCAAAAMERCARELCVELAEVTAMVDRALQKASMSEAFARAIPAFRRSPVVGRLEIDVHAYVRVLRAALSRARAASLDLVEALVSCGRDDWGIEYASVFAGTDRAIALDLVHHGIRRDRRRWRSDRFVGELDRVDVVERYGPSLPLVVECVRRFASAPRRELAAAARRAGFGLRGRDRDLASSYLAALTYVEKGADAALREIARASRRSDRQRALLVIVDAALLRGRHRDGARFIGELGRGHAALRGRLALIRWFHDQRRLRAARRQAARLELPREVRSRIIGSLRGESIWIPSLHPERCTCASCRLPRLIAPPVCRMRSLDEERADEIMTHAMRAVIAPPRLAGTSADWFEAGLRCEPRAPADIRDPRNLRRALYDEGVSLSTQRGMRRGVLIRAAKQVLAAELARTGTVRAPVLASRLRSLHNLGGVAPARALRQVLSEHPSSSSRWWPRAFELLAALAPIEARELALAHYAEIPPGAEVPRLLSWSGAVSLDFAARWVDLEARQAELLGRRRARAWVAELIATWRSRYGTLPPPDALSFEHWRGARNARSALLGIERMLQGKLERTPRSLVRAAADDEQLRRCLSLVAPARLPAGERPWSDGRIREELELLLSEASGAPNMDLVTDFLKHVPISRTHRAHIRASLSAGRLPANPLARELMPGWRARLLDKRHDLLTYLRFADAVWCCFHTESPYLDNRRRWMADAWHDPLTFCIHIDRSRASYVEPAGFVLGGFGLVDGAPAIIVNGVYLRGLARSSVRAAALAFLEDCVAGPLRIRLIGAAARHGGAGAMPDGYKLAHRCLMRSRALSRGGAPVRTTYDDVSTRVNEAQEVELWWKELPAP